MSDFPKLMKSKDGETIILMVDDGSGLVLSSKSNSAVDEVGDFSNCWDMKSFEPLPKGTRVTFIQS